MGPKDQWMEVREKFSAGKDSLEEEFPEWPPARVSDERPPAPKARGWGPRSRAHTWAARGSILGPPGPPLSENQREKCPRVRTHKKQAKQTKMATSCITLCCFEELGEAWGWDGQEVRRMSFVG